jgi:poly-beta-1,6-N-acetyl-D-glucosamine biosynthesis protein PgaD
MIINIKQSKLRKSLDLLLTIFGWIYLILFLFNFATHLNTNLNLRFYYLNLSNANAILIFTFLILVISSAALIGWSSYNKRKYGFLKRRNFPETANVKEISEYFQITEEELRLIQNSNYFEIK